MPKARTSVSVDETVLEEARGFGLNLSEIADRAFAEEVRKSKAERWAEENREAIERANAFTEKYGAFGQKYGAAFK